MMGTFKEGLKLVPDIEEKLEEYAIFLDQPPHHGDELQDRHLYFGSGDYSTCIDYLQKIINETASFVLICNVMHACSICWLIMNWAMMRSWNR